MTEKCNICDKFFTTIDVVDESKPPLDNFVYLNERKPQICDECWDWFCNFKWEKS